MRSSACVDGDRRLTNTEPYGEPQLGATRPVRRASGGQNLPDGQLAMLWVLNLSDGAHSLLDIAERSGLPFATVERCCRAPRGARPARRERRSRRDLLTVGAGRTGRSEGLRPGRRPWCPWRPS